MLYIYLKYIHILSSTVLFGTGLGTASVMLYGHLTQDNKIRAAIYKYVILADWTFTTPSAVVQPITGFWLVYIAGYPLTQFWIWASFLGYLIAAFCWFPVVYLQIQLQKFASRAATENMPLPETYHRYFKYWFILGWPAFISLVIVFYLMTAKPA